MKIPGSARLGKALVLRLMYSNQARLACRSVGAGNLIGKSDLRPTC
mgnify:CR=1 FL=1|jgi:hypothetical protein